MPSRADGPFISTALLCEEIIRDEDGVLSVTRIYEKVTVLGSGPAELHFNGLVIVHAGEARGVYPLVALVRSPSGEVVSDEFFRNLTLLSEADGLVTMTTVVVRPVEEGVHWFEVSVGSDVKTKVPLAIQWAPDVGRAKPSEPPPSRGTQ